jgi:hypothetical protein
MAPESTIPADRDAPAGAAPLPAGPGPVVDDMVDEQELRNPSLDPVLRQALAAIKETLLPVYAVADQRAIVSQSRHRLIATLAAATGTLAVLFGIGELGYKSLEIEASPWVAHIEAVFLFACLVSVVLGLTAALQTGWLDERHKAELCRMLKFRLLARPELWCGRLEEWKRRLREETAAIHGVAGKSAKEAARRDPEQDPLPEILPGAIPAGNLQVLADYYLAKRLDFQRAFYASRVARYHQRDRRLRHLPPLCFFASVAAALVHYLLKAFEHRPGGTSGETSAIDTAGILLLVLAAAVPVIGAGVRTYRMAYEFARSASLFQAKLNALDRFRQGLQHDLAATAPDPAAVLRRLWQCENFFEHEHHEWLRLMLEAEWFG